MEGSVKIGPCRGFGLSPAEQKLLVENIGAYQRATHALRLARAMQASLARPDLGPGAHAQIENEASSASHVAPIIDIAKWMRERNRVHR
jgi:hypothetical protein